MLLVDSLPNPLSASVDQLLQILEDIATNVQVESNFCIRHPDYQPIDLPSEVIDRFQRLPLDLQNKYLKLQLRGFLYGIYYNGSRQVIEMVEDETAGLGAQQNLENNTYLGVDLGFYERLHQSNCGEGYFDPGWTIVKQNDDSSLVVRQGGLTLHIGRDRHLSAEQQSAVVGDVVSIRLPRNLVQNGFYVAVGNVGSQGRRIPDREPETVRIYFNFSPEGALAVMNSLTRRLNESAIPFSFKALYNPADYKRYDSGVLYFNKSDYDAIHPVLQAVYAEHQAHFQPEVPLFTKPLAPGLAVAEEPNRKFGAIESFGLNRCQIVANGLLEAWHNGDDSPSTRLSAIVNHFVLCEVELERPYLNANSDDIYVPLNVCKSTI